MRYNLFLLLLLVFLGACSNDDDRREDNPNLIEPLVSLNLSLSLPEYNDLNFPGGSVIIGQQGIRGIVVYNVNNDLYTAFELSDPNHTPNECSRMTIDAPIASCPCESDANEYNIISGEHSTDPNLFPMLPYRVVRNGDVVRVSNF